MALYRAARPRSGKLGVVLKPFPRSAYLTRKSKPSTTPVKASSSAPIACTFNENEHTSTLELLDENIPSPSSPELLPF